VSANGLKLAMKFLAVGGGLIDVATARGLARDNQAPGHRVSDTAKGSCP
jgi:hypothetical protein